MMKFLTRNFFKGILLLLPITLTLYICYSIFLKIDHLGQKILGEWITAGPVLTGIGFLFTILLIVLIGYLSSFWLASSIFSWIEGQFSQSPLIKGLYSTIRETVNSFLGDKKFFSQSVLVRFPDRGYERLGFVTQDPPAFMDKGEEKIVVYLPHSFQISGEMVIVPKANVRYLDLAPEIALKLIMSAGIVKG